MFRSKQRPVLTGERAVVAPALIASALAAALLLLPQRPLGAPTAQPVPVAVETSILLYHRFGSIANDPMTVRTVTFRAQLDYLTRHRYPVIELKTLVSSLLGRESAPPPRAVVITADDGHSSVFTEMLPIIREYHVPVTVFTYPSAISNASYAMTWNQLAELHHTGLFDIQSHTYWHPNFNTERRRLSPTAYQSFVTMQLAKPRTVLREKTCCGRRSACLAVRHL